MKISPFIIVGLMLMHCGVAEANSMRTALSVELSNLGRFIELYHEQEGQFPQTWEELEKITPELDSTFPLLKPTKRMMLISQPIEMPRKYGGGLALAITREPFRPISWTQWPIIGMTHEYLKDPSYAIIVSMDGGSFLRHVSPDATRSIFESKGLPLPEKSGLGAFAYERNFMIRRIINWSVALAFGAWLVWRFMQKKHQRSESSNSA